MVCRTLLAGFFAVALLMLPHSMFSQQPSLPEDPAAFLQHLYGEVVKYQPLGVLDYEYTGTPTREIVEGNNAKERFEPYLSPRLRRGITHFNGCISAFEERFKDSPVPLKPPIFEGGIFSGGNELGDPEFFKVEHVSKQRDGTFRALIELSAPIDPPELYVWHVEAVLTREGSRLAVNEILFLPERGNTSPPERVSAILWRPCDVPPKRKR